MKKIVIWATDGSAAAESALDAARRLGELGDARLYAVHCDQRLRGRAAEWPALADEEERGALIRRGVEELRLEGFDVEYVYRRSHREAADVVALVAAELGADVIVCGTRGVGALAGAFLGSFTHRLLHVAPCPVLAVPEAQPARSFVPARGTEVHT